MGLHTAAFFAAAAVFLVVIADNVATLFGHFVEIHFAEAIAKVQAEGAEGDEGFAALEESGPFELRGESQVFLEGLNDGDTERSFFIEFFLESDVEHGEGGVKTL